jgi:hypothetical protein
MLMMTMMIMVPDIDNEMTTMMIEITWMMINSLLATIPQSYGMALDMFFQGPYSLYDNDV